MKSERLCSHHRMKKQTLPPSEAPCAPRRSQHLPTKITTALTFSVIASAFWFYHLSMYITTPYPPVWSVSKLPLNGITQYVFPMSGFFHSTFFFFSYNLCLSSVMCVVDILSHPVSVSFCSSWYLLRKFLILTQPNLSVFSSVVCTFWVLFKNSFPTLGPWRYAILSSKSFIILPFTFSSIIHLELTCVCYGDRDQVS